MSPALSKLRALQHQAAGAPPARAAMPARPARKAVSPADTQALRQALGLRNPRAARRAATAEDRKLPGEEIAPGLRLIKGRRPAPALPPRIDGGFDRRGDFASRRVLFFDTETTGLAGGTGTRAFMIGAAAWDGGALHTRQLLITRLGAEAAMLTEFARWLGPDTMLVSYNGKSFDAPLLRSRYRLARLRDPIADLFHIDLLHPARRRYRDRFDDCRLATLERKVLGITREHDLPGSEAPAAWLAWLRGGAAGKLRRVLQHNRQDVDSLARLLLHLAGAVNAAASPAMCASKT